MAGKPAESAGRCAMEQARLPCSRRRDVESTALVASDDGKILATQGETQMSATFRLIAASRRPPILSRRHRRPRLRLRHRQGAAVDDGRDLGDHRAALRQQRSRRFDTGCRRADLLACAAERAGQARDDRARVLRPRRVYAARTGMPVRSPPISPRAKSARNWPAVRSRRSGSASRSSSRPAPCIWSRPMPARPSPRN